MAEEVQKTIKIKVEFVGDSTNATAAAAQAAEGAEKVKKAVKESNDELGFADTKVGKMWTSFTGGAQSGIKAMSTLKGAVISTGIGALLIAVMGIVEWFKKTETGSDLLAKGSKILGQVVKEGPMAVFNALKIIVLALLIPIRTAIATFTHMKAVLSGKESLKEAVQGIKDDIKGFGEEIAETAQKFVGMAKNIGDAAKLADAWDKLDDSRRDRKIKDKQLDADIADLRERAADADEKLETRVKLLAEAQRLLSDQHKVLKADKEQEIKLIEEELRLYPDNQEWIEKLAVAKGDLADIDRKYSQDKKTIGKQSQAIEKAITADAKKESEERAKLKEKEMELIQALWDKNKKLREESLDRVKTDLDEAEEMQMSAFDREMDNLDDWQAKRLEVLGLTKEEEASITELYNQKALEIMDKYYQEDLKAYQDKEKEKQAADKETADLKEKQTGQALTSAADSLMKFSAAAKKGSAASKAFAIAATIIDTYQSATAAFKAMAGIPVVGPVLGAIAAAAAVAMGLKNIAEIRKTEPEKKALGGWLTGKSHTDGGIPIIAEGGEYIVNKKTMNNPQMAKAITDMNSAGNTGSSSAPILSEADVARIAASVVKSIPVIIDKETSNKVGIYDREVQQREARFVST